MAVSPRASAQTSEVDKSAAETLFDEGRRLSSEGKFAEACLKFADSNKLDPGVGTLLNLGQCYKSLGRSASAWSTFREAAALARASGQSDRETLARGEASALEPSLIRLSIEVPPELVTASLQIRRDGAAVPTSLWGLPTPIDPGGHVIEVSASGKRAQRLEVTPGAPGSTTKVVIPPLVDEPSSPPSAASATGGAAPPSPMPAALARPVQAPGASTQGSLVPAERGSGRSGLRVTGFVVGGIGAAALGAGVVFLALGKSQNEQALAACTAGANGDHCTSTADRNNHENHVRAARDNFRIGYVGLGVGAAGVASAVVLIALGSGGAKPGGTSTAGKSMSAWTLGPRLSPAELGLDWATCF
jgi:hypothetical protein